MESQVAYDRVLEFLLETLDALKKESEIPEDVTLDGEFPLIGESAVMDSRSLVVLLLALEDFIDEQYSATFDWTTDKAMSARHSPFRTPHTLAEFAMSEASL